MERPAQTALSSARVRFMDGLPERMDELRSVVEAFSAAPEDASVRDDLKRRLHALSAGAQVFEANELSRAVLSVAEQLESPDRRAPLAEQLLALHGLLDSWRTHVPASAEPFHAPAGARKHEDGSMATPQAGPAARDSGVRDRDPLEAPQDRQATVERSVAGTLPAPAFTAVLVVDSAPVRAEIRRILPEDRFEVWGTDDPEEAIRLMHVDSPDVALVSAEVASLPDVDLIRRLQTDPLSDVRAVYVLLPPESSYDDEFVEQTGADGVLVAPFDGESLGSLLGSRPRHSPRTLGALSALSEGTVDDVASRLADEIRTGIAESLQAGRNEKIRFDDATELMAVAWSAIGRVRAHLTEHSRGRIRFRSDALQDAPSLLSLDDDQPVEASDAELMASLQGRRVLVADDDPAVLWFFAGLAREAGAQVFEAQNGRAALELARRKRPHVVVSDILMPKIDGFALCREIKRDALLAHVPVILLSWKEDFLQRMRELDSGANGYLRKEAGSRQILVGLVECLRPRLRLEEQLRSQGEVRGRVEGLGITPLIETVAALRPNARVSVRDAANLFQVDVRNGKTLAVTRTAADGSFVRGDKALLQLVGVTSGRYVITACDTPVRSPSAEPLDKALSDATTRLATLLDAVSDTRLVHVGKLALDEEVVASLLTSTPTPLAQVIESFTSRNDGSSPAVANDLLLAGRYTPSELEQHLRELARCGAIVGVWSRDGEDLVAQAAQERAERPGRLLHSSNPPRPSEDTDAARARASLRIPKAHSPTLDDEHDARADARDWTGRHELAELAKQRTDAQTQAALAAGTARVNLRISVAADDDGDDVQEPMLGQGVTLPPGVSERREGLRLVVSLAVLLAIGFFGWQKLERVHRGDAAYAVKHGASDGPARATQVAPQAQPAATAAPAATPVAADAVTDTSARLQVLPNVEATHGVSVGPEQGLLVIDFGGAGEAPAVSIGEQNLGKPPLALALASGKYDVTWRSGEQLMRRQLELTVGQTAVLTLAAATP